MKKLLFAVVCLLATVPMFGAATVNLNTTPDIDICQGIANAITAIPYPGGDIDATSYRDVQQCSVNPFASMGGKTVRLLLGKATIEVANGAGWVVPEDTEIIGMGRSFTRIKAASGFTGTLIRIGDGTKLVFATRLKNFTVDLNGLSGVTGVYSNSMESQSGIYNVSFMGIAYRGLDLDATVANTIDGYRQEYYTLDNLEFLFPSGANASAAVGLRINGGGTGPLSVTNIVANGRSTSVVPGKLIIVNNVTKGVFSGIHVENGTIGLDLAETTPLSGLTFFGITGHSTVTDLVRIHAQTGKTQGFMLFALQKNFGTNAIVDEDRGITLTNQAIAQYSAGSGTNIPVFYIKSDRAVFTGAPVAAEAGFVLGSTTAPTCNSGNAGRFNYLAGAAGVKDSVQVCAKDAGDAYAWRTIY